MWCEIKGTNVAALADFLADKKLAIAVPGQRAFSTFAPKIAHCRELGFQDLEVEVGLPALSEDAANILDRHESELKENAANQEPPDHFGNHTL